MIFPNKTLFESDGINTFVNQPCPACIITVWCPETPVRTFRFCCCWSDRSLLYQSCTSDIQASLCWQDIRISKLPSRRTSIPCCIWHTELRTLSKLTLEFAHGKQIPNVNTANNAPFRSYLKLIYLKDSVQFFDHKYQNYAYDTADHRDALHNNASRQIGHFYAHHFHYKIFVNRTGYSVDLS
ncbi:hypothetical protein AGLY_001574 [Aphis glycines]|uniref:Uncharacterized protein n=1 Tax=Aphis glycines TaxID=307491 RepID=A0A6G0U5J7_APHGL|nr:hypothetical protein AGLY_001574 [Aphis glycines]